MTTLDPQQLVAPDQTEKEEKPLEFLTLTLTDLMREEDDLTMAPIIETLWPDGTLGFLGGPSKAGKSSYAIEEAICLANGWPVFGKYAVSAPKRVLFIEEEDDRAKVRERYQAVMRQHGGDPKTDVSAPLWFFIGQGFRTDDRRSLFLLRERIIHFDIDVVYLDALTRMCDKPALEKSTEIMAALQGITKINNDLGTAFRVVHHTTKSTGGTASGQDLLGGPVLRAWARSSLMFGERSKGATTISYEGKGAAGGPVCRMKTLATDAVPATATTPGVRSLFAGLEWLPLRAGMASKDVTTTEPTTLARPLSATDEQALAALPCTAGALVEGGMAKMTAYDALRRLGRRGLAEKGEGGVWTRAPAAAEAS